MLWARVAASGDCGEREGVGAVFIVRQGRTSLAWKARRPR
jgi:hypothetical protein